MVGPVWTEPFGQADAQPENPVHLAQLVCLSLRASGVQWDWLQLDLRLRLPDGSPLLAHQPSHESQAPGALGSTDPKPFHIGSRLPVLRDPLFEKRLYAMVSADMLAGETELPDHVLANLRAVVAGAVCECEAELSLRASRPTRAIRSLRVLAIDASIESGKATPAAADAPLPARASDQTDTRQPKEPAAGLAWPRRAQPAEPPRTLRVLAYVEATGLADRPLLGEIAIGQPAADEPLQRETQQAIDRGDRSIFRQTKLQRVLDDQAQIFEFAVPLENWGGDDPQKRLTIRMQAECEALHAIHETQFCLEAQP